MKHGRNLRKAEGVGWDLCLERCHAPANTICAKTVIVWKWFSTVLVASVYGTGVFKLNHDMPIFILILTCTPEFVVPPHLGKWICSSSYS
jgi:hypothetical protein